MTDLAWMRPKLAELCGLTVDSERFRIGATYMHGKDPVAVFDDWRPDEDVAQAVRCLDAVLKNNAHATIGRGRIWFVEIDGGVRLWAKQGDPSFSRAIVLAIAAALGWEKP